MKVSDIIAEQFDDCVGDQVKEIFNKKYEDISGVVSMGFDEILDLMRDAQVQQKDINFKKEEDILNRFLQTTDEETIYIYKDPRVLERLNQLHDMMNSEGSIMTVVTAIQEFVRLLVKHTVTESDWENSDEGQEAMQQAEEVCNEPSDSHARTGMKPSDFF